ncbi:MAG TPA: PP2C family serine/threonine-protein phosphatase [Gammaproteobacteria bacterium]|nr:PP2C family serine/threonine-protein phosphatase [Gammaproteobacteria bacterium]
MRAESAVFSAAGARPYNEDRLGQRQTREAAFWAVADGLGGHEGGARAATLAVDSGLAAATHLSRTHLEDLLKQAVSEAHVAVRAGQKGGAGFADMRSTLVLLGVKEGDAAWAHCGDSRLYHFRDGELVWRTRDHSAAQLLVTAGEITDADISSHPDRSRLVSCLGGQNPLLTASRRLGRPPAPGDRFLLCSDGLWENFTDGELVEAATAAADPGVFLRDLAARVAAAAHPSQDNYSAVAVFIGPA